MKISNILPALVLVSSITDLRFVIKYYHVVCNKFNGLDFVVKEVHAQTFGVISNLIYCITYDMELFIDIIFIVIEF